MTGYIGFLPCRAGSERVPHKNTRPFADQEGGLLGIKLRQLSAIRRLEGILVSSNDPIVLDYCEAFRRDHDGRVQPVERPDELGRGTTAMDDFIRYIATLSETGTILFTHVTSPFVRTRDYEAILDAYEGAVAKGHDCLITVTKLHKFLWTEAGPLNYDPHPIKWPRSQDIRPVMEINHAAYVMPFALMREMGDRVGRKPFFMPLPEAVAMDIDWEEQFHLLEDIARLHAGRGDPLV